MLRCPALVMPEVFIITDPADSSVHSSEAPSIAIEMKKAILDAGSSDVSATVLRTTELDSFKGKISQDGATKLLCPLTLTLPAWLPVPNPAIYTTCSDINGLRQTVSQHNYQVGDGASWLPIVWTAKGSLYGEAIAQIDGMAAPSYQQPLHLVDSQRQPLYRLGQTLLSQLKALPGVYLLQFGVRDHEVWFDRLIPFPGTPAIASLGVQTPDLFLCHWLCLAHRPILDLKIVRS